MFVCLKDNNGNDYEYISGRGNGISDRKQEVIFNVIQNYDYDYESNSTCYCSSVSKMNEALMNFDSQKWNIVCGATSFLNSRMNDFN